MRRKEMKEGKVSIFLKYKRLFNFHQFFLFCCSTESLQMSSSISETDLDNNFQLNELPGVHEHADRAAIGMLKSFASIHRDNNLRQFMYEVRLTNGNPEEPFHAKITFGLDAGYAMEGAVGSVYKVDATYLGPHVNMASRMQSACKQFGVSLLCSKDFQCLLSPEAKQKFRHVDTCTVKGVQKAQPIYTYDARHRGINLFLNKRDCNVADIEAKNYSPKIWNTDQDLKCMRQHITSEFEDKFNKGRDLYLVGNWKEAVKVLKEANEQMIRNNMKFDMVEFQASPSDVNNVNTSLTKRLTDIGDGPSKCLINYMIGKNGQAPAKFVDEKCRALESK